MKYPLLSAFCILLFFLNAGVSCKKNIPNHPKEEVLPPETQSGERTFGCLINGEVWTAKGGGSTVPRLTAEYHMPEKLLIVKAAKFIRENNQDVKQYISIYAENVDSPGAYEMNSPERNIDFSDVVTDCYYITNDSQSGNLEITKLDFVKRIVSGRFRFSVKTSDCEDVSATEGRFDVPF